MKIFFAFMIAIAWVVLNTGCSRIQNTSQSSGEEDDERQMREQEAYQRELQEAIYANSEIWLLAVMERFDVENVSDILQKRKHTWRVLLSLKDGPIVTNDYVVTEFHLEGVVDPDLKPRTIADSPVYLILTHGEIQFMGKTTQQNNQYLIPGDGNFITCDPDEILEALIFLYKAKAQGK